MILSDDKNVKDVINGNLNEENLDSKFRPLVNKSNADHLHSHSVLIPKGRTGGSSIPVVDSSAVAFGDSMNKITGDSANFSYNSTTKKLTVGGNIDVVGQNILTGASNNLNLGDDSTVVSIGQTNEIWFCNDLDSEGTGYINWRGYNSGGTRYRNLIVGDGKSAEIAKFEASTKKIIGYGEIDSPKVKLTADGGIAIKLTNKTGADSVRGKLVMCDPSVNNAVEIASANCLDCIGAFYESGIADGSEVWVAISGRVYVLLKDNTAATRGYFVRTSSEAGYADATTAVPPGGGVANLDIHMQEIGHSLNTVPALGAGFHNSTYIMMHFN